MTREVRFGIAGCGGMGRWHARALRSLPGLALVGVADPDARACARLAREFDVRAHASVEALVGDPAVEVVSVCTPPATHLALVEIAARARKHVLVEKPLALSVAEADRAIAACDAAAVQLGVVHQQRARSATRALSDLVERGELGRPLTAAAIHTWLRSREQLARDGWRDDAGSGGGVLADQAIHAIDLLTMFLGTPRWVSGTTAVLALGTSAEDTAAANIGFAGGAVASLVATTASNRMRDDIVVEFSGTGGGFRLEIRDYDHAEIAYLEIAGGRGGRARRLTADEVEALVRRYDGRWRSGPPAWPWRALERLAGGERGRRPFRSPRSFLRRYLDRAAQRQTGEPQGHAAVLQAMAAAVRGDGRPVATGRDARDSIAILEGIHRSHASGGARVELFGSEPR